MVHGNKQAQKHLTYGRVKIKSCTDARLPWYRPHLTKVFSVKSLTSSDDQPPAGISKKDVYVVNQVTSTYHGQYILKEDCIIL